MATKGLKRRFAGAATFVLLAAGAVSAAAADTLVERIAPPPGFVRPAAAAGSFAAWLRTMPLKPAATPVRLFNGALKPRQDVQAAVVDIDVGSKDLQQCADAVMRLRAEWQFATGRAREVQFNDTGGGQPMKFSRWADGERPSPQGKGLAWSKRAAADASYASFRRYLDTVFVWAGTYSLERELAARSARDVAAGDVVIRGGFPGHAVIVADVAVNPADGEKRVLLAQSFMPAQDIHVLKNFANNDGSPWYRIVDGAAVSTPEWSFPPNSLKTWK